MADTSTTVRRRGGQAAVPAAANVDAAADCKSRTEEHSDDDAHDHHHDHDPDPDPDGPDDHGSSPSSGATTPWHTAHDYLGSHAGKAAEVHRLKNLVKRLTRQLRAAKLHHKDEPKHDKSASRLIHVMAQPSPLSPDNHTPADFRGFLNLVVIIAVVTNLRVIFENLIKYGVLVGNVRLPETQVSLAGFAVFAVVMAAHVAMALGAEKLCATRGRMAVAVGTALHVLNCVAPVVTALVVARAFNIGAFVSINIAMGGLVVHLKLISFAHCNHDLRVAKKEPYPANVNAKSLALFMAFPTLVYQTSYPRTKRIRWAFVGRRLFQFVVCLSLMAVIMQQFLVPTIQRAAQPLREANLPKIMERLMETAIPSLALWLLMFWGMFELWLNIVAEVTFFADREFYQDWWNSRQLDTYWRKWNRPVHHWMLRHLYVPMCNWRVPKPIASMLVFVWSALLHEYAVSGPFRTWEYWAFIGMMSQIPLISLTRMLGKALKGTGLEQIGNVVFWTSFCFVGQPLCLLLYYQDLSNVTGTQP